MCTQVQYSMKELLGLDYTKVANTNHDSALTNFRKAAQKHLPWLSICRQRVFYSNQSASWREFYEVTTARISQSLPPEWNSISEIFMSSRYELSGQLLCCPTLWHKHTAQSNNKQPVSTVWLVIQKLG